jgi:hypothetical protein
VSATAWLVLGPAIAAIALAVFALVRRGRAEPFPLRDAPALGLRSRRTAFTRFGLLALLGGALAATFMLVPRPTGELSSLVPSGRNTLVVLDMSQSVSDLVYREIARTLQGVVTATGPNGRVGLVLFSDVAQLALPPGSHAVDLQPFTTFFRPKDQRGMTGKPIYYRAAGPTEQALVQYPLNPWFGHFSAGTQISTGLALARSALTRVGGGRAILLSDLQDDVADLPRLTRELVAWSGDPALELRIVALPPATAADKSIFTQITGRPEDVVDSLDLATGNRGAGEPRQGMSIPFLAVVLVLALVLSASLLRATPLRWSRSQ